MSPQHPRPAMYYRLVCATALSFGSLMCVSSGAGETSPDLVSTALRAELAGNNAARQQSLQQALHEATSPAAHWQCGRVSTPTGEWIDFRNVPAQRLMAIDEYRARRDAADNSVAALLELADWCRDHHLADAEQAHLQQILDLDGGHPQARQRLGHVQVEGWWITPEAIAQAQRRQAERHASLQQFQADILALKQQLRGTPYERREGRRQLMELRDPAAVATLEELLTGGSIDNELLLIEWLSQINLFESSQAMARTALRSERLAVQRAAAAQLRQRPLDHFVPVLLGAMKTPVTLKSHRGLSQDGWYVLELYFQSDTESQHRQLKRSTRVARQRLVQTPHGAIISGRADAYADVGDHSVAQRLLLLRERQAEQSRLEWNRRIRQTNQRAELVMRHVTGDADPRDPVQWWDWWAAYNQVYVAGSKPLLRVVQDPERLYIEERSKELTSNPFRPSSSCFAAGTPVWTERGAIPIEQIAVGDRVLSQDVDTGELAYQPVLGTTARPPAPLIRLTSASISLQGTGGHPLWINGIGWTFLSDLEPGMHLHGTSGAQPVLSVEPAGEGPAYNLIVADFHTYFLGEGQILCHDNTTRQPTNSLVPGLHRQP